MTFSYFAREDNNTANNPALNLTGDPAVELTFVKPAGGGDITLEADGGAPDPDTLVEIGGQTYSFTYEFSAELPTAQRNGAQQVPDHLEGEPIVLITVHDYPEPGESARFMFHSQPGTTQAEMDDFGTGAIDVQAIDETPSPTAVCFARGTLIATPDGDRPVESLRRGDLVTTADGRQVELRWVSFSHHSYRELVAQPNLRPVCIPRGWMGCGMPHTDLWVSPQHRIVLRGWRAELNLACDAVFIPAKRLMGEPGTPGADRLGGVDYFHLLFDAHEIVLSNGLESESFFPGKEAVKSLNPQARAELTAVLAEMGRKLDDCCQTTLPTVTACEAAIVRPPIDAPLRAA